MKTKKYFKQVLCAIMSCMLGVSVVGCGNTTSGDTDIKNINLSKSTIIDISKEDIKPQDVKQKEIDDDFTNSYTNFSFELFKESVTENKNSLVSPLSVIYALSMTANGANDMTRTEMQKVLGNDISIETLNEYLYTYMQKTLADNTLKIGNSIWFNSDYNISIKKDFLQTNANYYSANMYNIPFDDNAVVEMNSWVKNHTDNMIDKIIDELDSSFVMFLMNAIAFDAKWEKAYSENDIKKEQFTDINNETKLVDMMYSTENKYIKTDNAIGFIKNYSGNKYSFVALLPDKNININDYVATLNTNDIISAIKNAENTDVSVNIPKFTYEYDINMNNALKDMGIVQAFYMDSADFSNITNYPIYIGSVLHKTFISVDEKGTKAAAVTAVIMDNGVVGYTVKLDRPFVYMIVDNTNSLPIFMGTVMTID